MPYLLSDDEIRRICGEDGYGIGINKVRDIIPAPELKTPFTNLTNYQPPTNFPPPESKISFASVLSGITGTNERTILERLNREVPVIEGEIVSISDIDKTRMRKPVVIEGEIVDPRFISDREMASPMYTGYTRYDPYDSEGDTDEELGFEEFARSSNAPAPAPAEAPAPSEAPVPADSAEAPAPDPFEAPVPPPPLTEQQLANLSEKDRKFYEDFMREFPIEEAPTPAPPTLEQIQSGEFPGEAPAPPPPEGFVMSKAGNRITPERQQRAREGQFKRRERAGMAAEDIREKYNGHIVRSQISTPGNLRKNEILNNQANLLASVYRGTTDVSTARTMAGISKIEAEDYGSAFDRSLFRQQRQEARPQVPDATTIRELQRMSTQMNQALYGREKSQL